MDELPFKCELCGDYFKWRNGHKNHLDTEHKNKESLSDEFWVEGLVEVIKQYVLQNVYAQEFQSAHVHNNLSNFQKADGVAVMMGQLAPAGDCPNVTVNSICFLNITVFIMYMCTLIVFCVLKEFVFKF